MEESKKRTDAISALRGRMNTTLGTRINDHMLLQVACACAFRERDELLGFLLPSHLSCRVKDAASTLAISPEQFEVIFCCRSTRETPVANVTASSDFKEELSRIKVALKNTVLEAEQSASFSRPHTQALSYVALHMSDSDSALQACLGSVVRTDCRKLDDLREELDEYGVDTMLVASVLSALSSSVL